MCVSTSIDIPCDSEKIQRRCCFVGYFHFRTPDPPTVAVNVDRISFPKSIITPRNSQTIPRFLLKTLQEIPVFNRETVSLLDSTGPIIKDRLSFLRFLPGKQYHVSMPVRGPTFARWIPNRLLTVDYTKSAIFRAEN